MQEDSGATAVEFALILPLLLVLVVTLIDFGRIGFVQVSLISAAREGARYSSLYSSGFTDSTTFNNYVQATAPKAAQISQMVSTASLNVSVTKCSATISNENTTVTVSTVFKWLLPVGLIKWIDSNATWVSDLTLSSTGVIRCMN